VSDEHTPLESTDPDLVADGVDHPLDPRYVSYGRAAGAIVVLVIGSVLMAAAVVVLLAVDMPFAAMVLTPVCAVALIAAVALFAWRWPLLEHRHSSYRVDQDGIEIRKGVWWRSVVNVPRSRIQHTDVSQGPLERNFDLATLHVFTAGTEHSEVTLSGLEHARALRIRDHLLLIGDDHDAV
jgi:membrane protein YdbS with pleckstrin-like domain